ncbi:MAG: hypothetical protein EA378_00770 [Phycisphaerales bacterium]|nr:MAG: hypothetical protein EA378_00770 [Phycisphaerales bacterium]
MSARRLLSLAVRAGAVLLTAGVAVLLVALADRLPTFDVTATGAHRLSERTRLVLDRASREGERLELVIAADLARLDRRARERTGDVLDAIARAAPGLRTTTIDTGSPSGLDEYRALLERLRERESALLDEHQRVLSELSARLTGVGDFAERTLQTRLRAIGEAVADDAPDAASFQNFFREEQPVGARLLARDLRGYAETVERESNAEIPQLVAIRASLDDALNNVDAQLLSLAGILSRFAAIETMTPAARDAASGLIPLVRGERDALAIASERLRALRPADIARVSRALERAETVLVIGPVREAGAGLAAVDANELFPSTAALDAVGSGGADLRRRAEELLATAIGVVSDPIRPIVIVTHAEPQAFLFRVPLMRALTERLNLRGIDVAEWATVLDEDPPVLTDLDPAGVRPIVYLTLAPDSSAASQSNPDLSGPRRAQTLGEATRRILESGDNAVVSLNPSVLPGYGEADPTARPLRALGIDAMTGRPLLSTTLGQSGPVVETDRVVIPEGASDTATDHPVSSAIGGLRTMLIWPIALDLTETPGVRTWSLMSFAGGDRWWAESSWLRVWQTPREQRRFIAQPPTFDEARDERRDRWTVAAAAERELPPELSDEDRRTQRVIVVGSNGWHIDPVTQQAAEVDGRVVPLYPGNLEFLEAAVWWLSHRDGLIARSERARAAPTVRAMSDGEVLTWRLGLLLGLPLGILALGLAWRVIRG